MVQDETQDRVTESAGVEREPCASCKSAFKRGYATALVHEDAARAHKRGALLLLLFLLALGAAASYAYKEWREREHA